MEAMKTLPIRLTPGQDLRAALEAAVQAQNCRAAFVLSGIGSLSTAGIRLAGAAQPTRSPTAHREAETAKAHRG